MYTLNTELTNPSQAGSTLVNFNDDDESENGDDDKSENEDDNESENNDDDESEKLRRRQQQTDQQQ